MPSKNCIQLNAHALARYAALCQQAQMVPIVEPEVLMDGSHDIDRCFDVTSEVLQEVFTELNNQKVALNGIVLKPNMVISGVDSANRADIQQWQARQSNVFRRMFPMKYPALHFCQVDRLQKRPLHI